MIKNLNSLSLQPYGTALTQDPDRSEWEQARSTVALSQEQSFGWACTGDTWLWPEKGMAVLSLSADGENYQDFYLDKPVILRGGVSFHLTAFQSQAAVAIAAPTMPVVLTPCAPIQHLYMSRRLNIERIYTFFYQEKEPGFLFSGESHEATELFYVDSGSLHCVVDGRDHILKQGELMLFAPDQWHMQYADMDVSPKFITLAFDGGDYDLSRLYDQKFAASHRVVELLQQMLREQEREDPLSEDMLISLLSLMLLQLLRHCDAPAERLRSAHGLNNENDIIRRAQQYISTHVRSRLTVPLVAQHAAVSPSYLTALFHKHLQISPGEYIRRIKLQESKQMIREGNMNFTEIAQALHYSTIHHFSRQFKEKFGVTPSQFAKSIR